MSQTAHHGRLHCLESWERRCLANCRSLQSPSPRSLLQATPFLSATRRTTSIVCCGVNAVIFTTYSPITVRFYHCCGNRCQDCRFPPCHSFCLISSTHRLMVLSRGCSVDFVLFDKSFSMFQDCNPVLTFLKTSLGHVKCPANPVVTPTHNTTQHTTHKSNQHPSPMVCIGFLPGSAMLHVELMVLLWSPLASRRMVAPRRGATLRRPGVCGRECSFSAASFTRCHVRSDGADIVALSSCGRMSSCKGYQKIQQINHQIQNFSFVATRPLSVLHGASLTVFCAGHSPV